MAVSGPTASQRGALRDHGFHPLRVQRVVRETADASSFVLDVPPELRPAFVYEAGQFCTFRVRIDGQTHLRCYSMSSSPAVDVDLQVTVKRVAGGVVSNWMNDTLAPGNIVDATCPAGVFCLGPDDRDVVAFAAGSGITPVLSLLKTALATTSRRVRLLYANQGWDAVIFKAELDALTIRYGFWPGAPANGPESVSTRHGHRLGMVHHLDVEQGFVDAEAVQAFVGSAADADFYICGPTPFMDIVERALLAEDVDPARIHIERFSPAEPDAAPEPAADAPATSRVTIELDGRSDTADHHPGTTILQTARQLGMAAPFSCESGSCATCMAKVVEGAVTMHTNNALTDDEVADGWVLTCQAVPTTASVRVVYED